MFRRFLKVGLCIGLTACALVSFARPVPMNLSFLKAQLLRYHNSGQYAYGLWHVATKARRYLAERVSENKASKHPKKLAVVFDIDETALSNYKNNLHYWFTLNSQEMRVHLDQANDPAIPGTLMLYRYAVKHHVAVFFITGRHQAFYKVTVKNLKRAGYTHWAGLYLKPKGYRGKSAAGFKSVYRKHIESQGYDIVFSIGDQYSDLAGGYADRLFKLPNPFYYVP